MRRWNPPFSSRGPLAHRPALLAVAVVLAAGCSSDADPSAPTSTVAQVVADDPAAARAAVVGVVDRLLSEPVRTRTDGSAGGQTVELEATTDPRAGSMWLVENLNATIRTELVLIGDVIYGNIYPIDQDEPPFTVTRPGDLAADFLAMAYTGGGRVFGDVATLAAVFDRAPATVFELGVRAGDDGEQTGYRFEFDASDIGQLLQDEGLERSVQLPGPGEETTTIEVWLDERLRELSTSGSVYQDGELIDDVELVIRYEATDDPDITVPTDTLAS